MVSLSSALHKDKGHELKHTKPCLRAGDTFSLWE